MTKVSDKRFWSALEENGGLFSQTAKHLFEKHGIEISRQSIRERANKDPQRLIDIEDGEFADKARGVLHQHMDLTGKDEQMIRQRAAEYYLRYKGSKHGFVESSRMDITSGGEKIKFPIPVIRRSEKKKNAKGTNIGKGDNSK